MIHTCQVDGVAGDHRCLSGDSLAEWRSLEQVENGNPSTSPSYWDTDDEDPGPRPSDLYGKFTWKVEGFSQISKRELRSNVFEVGGYKWYILIYPQGCDVCNHLSLFLCVANHDKLLPGWSHFAQFTIAVVNTDSKKSKYSDTLHRFWKKEHDWGWKKFMELSKVSDGFLVDDALVIKAQVQVIREKAHQPFRCLDCQYRRELVRVYLSNVEKLCRRYVEEKRSKFIKIIEDKLRWSSLHAFWLAVDHNTRRRMSCDKTEAVLKVVVKHFFIENEVTSTLVMDYLYTGLKVLECQSKIKDGMAQLLEIEEIPEPLVFLEKDVFVLTDDVLTILERAALEPLPPKDDKVSQNHTRLKEYSSGDDLESIELDERRLTELGRRTVEMFAVNHIFSMIEIAYQEAVAFRRQEELIREEEAAESELRSRRHSMEKEKRTKKKQVKQKKNSRKNKEKGRSEKSDSSIKRRLEEIDIISSDALEEPPEDLPPTLIKESNPEAVSTDGGEMNRPESEEREASPTSCDTDTSEVHLVPEARSADREEDQTDRKTLNLGDVRSSRCAVYPVLPSKEISSARKKTTNSRSRRKNQQYVLYQNSESLADFDQRREHNSLDSSVKLIDRHLVKDEALTLERQRSSPVQLESEPSRPNQSTENQRSVVASEPTKENSKSTVGSALTRKTTPPGPRTQNDKPLTPVRPKSTSSIGSDGRSSFAARNTVLASQPASPLPKPSGVPPSSKPRPPSTTALSSALLSSPMSSASWLGSRDPPASTVGHTQSYRNAIIGRTASGSVPRSSPPSHTVSVSSPMTAQTISGQLLQAQGPTHDEFPHIDIINDLLNEEYSAIDEGQNGYIPSSYSAPDESYFFQGGSTSVARVDEGYLSALGGHLYEELIMREGGYPGRSTMGQRVHLQPFDRSSVYVNGLIDGPAQKQWHPGSIRTHHSEGEYYYDHQDYLDMIRVMNGFSGKFHPSNGH
ncbi:TNF receptor-associated factor homolog 1a-like isoform X2 [Wolffia australiana]